MFDRIRSLHGLLLSHPRRILQEGHHIKRLEAPYASQGHFKVKVITPTASLRCSGANANLSDESLANVLLGNTGAMVDCITSSFYYNTSSFCGQDQQTKSRYVGDFHIAVYCAGVISGSVLQRAHPVQLCEVERSMCSALSSVLHWPGSCIL
jgi:hypothetical protein